LYQDDVKVYKVRVFGTDRGEEHQVRTFPLWQYQKDLVRTAFGREMISDDSQPAEDGVVFVKPADGSHPYPTIEKVLACTIGQDGTEYCARIHRKMSHNRATDCS
jgi:hypothetical protein